MEAETGCRGSGVTGAEDSRDSKGCESRSDGNGRRRGTGATAALLLGIGMALASPTEAEAEETSKAPGSEESSRAEASAGQATEAGEEEVAAPEEDVEVLVVTGTPRDTALGETTADVDVVAGREKRRRQATSLGASIEQLPGVWNIGTGSQAGKPVIRGLSGNRVRILQDGIGVSHQQFGVRHPPNVDPLLAERLEVVRGASSILYGSDALGGAVNVIPRRVPYAPDGELDFGGRVTGGYESATDEWIGVVEGEAAHGPMGVSAGIAFRDGGNLETPDTGTFEPGDPPGDDPLFDGELDFTDFEQVNGTIRWGYLTELGEISARYEGWRNEHNFLLPDPPPPFDGRGIGQNLENDLGQLKADLRLDDTWTIRPSFTVVRNLRESNAPGDPLPVGGTPSALDVERFSYTTRIEARHEPLAGLFEGTIGFEALYEDQQSKGPVGLTPGGTVENYALFALERVDLDFLVLEAGLRYDHRRQEADPDETEDFSLFDRDADGAIDPGIDLENDWDVVTASLGALVPITEELSLAANLGRGFRAPDLFELYVNGQHGGVAAIQRGDPSLDEERSFNSDLQLRWRSDRVRLTATVYRNAISDFIFLAGTGTTDPGSGLPIFQVSQDDAVLWGGDASASVDVTPWLELRGTYEIVRGELDDAGEDVPLLPADRITAAARFTRDRLGPLEASYLELGLRHAFNKDAAGLLEPFGQFDDPPPPFGTASTDAYTLFDLGIGFEVDRFAVDFAVENVLNEDYRDFLDTYKAYALSPGRNISLQVSVDL